MLIKNLNLAVRFILEMWALIAVGYWGFKYNSNIVMKIVLGIGAPLLIAVVWGMFGSPKATYKISVPLQWLLICVIYLLASLALYTSGKQQMALLFGVIAIINSILMYVWKQ
jgi:hypothetical protein